MTKKELIEKISKRFPHLNSKLVCQQVDFLLQTIKDNLAQGECVEVRGFGRFTIREWGARYARNPITGESWRTKPQQAIHFRAGKELRELVNLCFSVGNDENKG